MCRNSFLDATSVQQDVETNINYSGFISNFYKNFLKIVSNATSTFFKK